MSIRTHFAGSIRSGRDDVPTYRKIIEHMRSLGEVLTEHVGDYRLSLEGQTSLSDQFIHDRDVAWQETADCVVVHPDRKNNVFAQAAETLWVLSGRDDLDFLSEYLPQAVDFSDDGKTWRAAYGPRLRRWNAHIDQLEGVSRRFEEDHATKRAIVAIFDPEKDFVDTKDVPCNNLLHFLIRDGKLHANVTARANDVIWGFSGINVFEWSVVQERAFLDLVEAADIRQSRSV